MQAISDVKRKYRFETHHAGVYPAALPRNNDSDVQRRDRGNAGRVSGTPIITMIDLFPATPSEAQCAVCSIRTSYALVVAGRLSGRPTFTLAGRYCTTPSEVINVQLIRYNHDVRRSHHDGIKNRYQAMTTADLKRMVHVEYGDYRPEAIVAARSELASRGELDGQAAITSEKDLILDSFDVAKRHYRSVPEINDGSLDGLLSELDSIGAQLKADRIEVDEWIYRDVVLKALTAAKLHYESLGDDSAIVRRLQIANLEEKRRSEWSTEALLGLDADAQMLLETVEDFGVDPFAFRVSRSRGII